MINYLVTAVFGAGLLSACIMMVVYMSYMFVHYRWDQKIAGVYREIMTKLDHIKRM